MPASRAAPAALAAALVLGGCSGLGGEPPAPTRLTAAPEGAPTLPPVTPSFTTVDSTFSQMMIPHHAQAVELADLVPERTDNPELRTLAREIADAQQPEIDRMAAWLEEWGLPTEIDLAERGDQGEGMLTDDEMRALGESDGAEFDRLWLESMIAHHEGAVVMAETVLSSGVHRPTLTLAEEIIRDREAEITRMRAMLGP